MMLNILDVKILTNAIQARHRIAVGKTKHRILGLVVILSHLIGNLQDCRLRWLSLQNCTSTCVLAFISNLVSAPWINLWILLLRNQLMQSLKLGLGFLTAKTPLRLLSSQFSLSIISFIFLEVIVLIIGIRLLNRISTVLMRIESLYLVWVLCNCLYPWLGLSTSHRRLPCLDWIATLTILSALMALTTRDIVLLVDAR